MIDRDIFLRDAPDDVREDLAFAQWQENNRIGTHAEGCHTWGIGHYACALRRITELAAQLADAIDDAHREARELDRVNVKLAEAKKDAAIYQCACGIKPQASIGRCANAMPPYCFVKPQKALMICCLACQLEKR